MFDPSVIRAKLIANLATLATAQGFQTRTYAGTPTPPTIEVFAFETIEYDVAMHRGGDQVDAVIRAYVANGLAEGAQIKLDQLVASSGSTSVKAAIESDLTLGGTVDDLRVTRCVSGLVFNGTVIGAEWEVQIETTG